MATSFFAPPSAPTYALRKVRAPACLLAESRVSSRSDGLVDLDLIIDHGRIAQIAPAGSAPAELGPDLGWAVVWPGFADIHTHLDKGHIWPRASNPDGAHSGARPSVEADRRAHWSAEDVRRRMEFALACAYAHGVVAIRTHLDVWDGRAAGVFAVFDQLRRAWAGRIELQAVSLQGAEVFLGEEGVAMADVVAQYGAVLGCVTRFSAQSGAEIPERFDEAMDRMFALAMERDLDIDLHVDETHELASRTLLQVARAARRNGFKGGLLCGHCCSLAQQPFEVVEETLTACAEAGVDIVSLPQCNMYLQGRQPGATPRWRGVTLLHEAKAHGLRVAVGGDNVRDPFYAYGDHDMLEVFTQAVRIAHLDHPFDDWAQAATRTPAAIMKLPELGIIRQGGPADLVVLRARSFSEMLARPQADRAVIRRGVAIDTTLPDYSLLDDLVGGP
jgi:cytosine deaminase